MKHRPLVPLAIPAVVVAAFIGGFAAETTSLFEERWLGLLTLVALALLLTAALAATLQGKARLLTALALGLPVGSLAGIVFVLGAFSPSALELGGRDLYEFGGDMVWEASLAWALIVWGAAGAVLGPVCGTAAWILCISLGRRSSDRRPDATEAGR
jgi:hypothetical protein